jgi:3'-5' exonuclease
MQKVTPTLPNNILFPDIETVPQYRNIAHMAKENPKMYELYLDRFDAQILKIANDEAGSRPNYEFACIKHYEENAALYAEFGKVVCVSIGRIDKERNLLIKSLCGRHEKELLTEVRDILNKAGALCAFNGKEFDFPFLMRRMIVHGIELPDVLNTFNKKPWETALIDPMVMWSGTAWNYKMRLDIICHTLGIESPKQDMTGADVAPLWYSMFDDVQNDELPFEKESEVVKKISKYCSGDVIAQIQLFLRLHTLPVIQPNQIVYV